MAEESGDYVASYRKFFEDFAATVNPEDQLPVQVPSYKIYDEELPGSVLYFASQYLKSKDCPRHLMPTLVNIVLENVKQAAAKYPVDFGYDSDAKFYNGLRLMQGVMTHVNAVCASLLDNARLEALPTPRTPAAHLVSSHAVKNTRRMMEDRHVAIDDLDAMFGLETKEPTGLYAVYDGHAGPLAASYCAIHLHQNLVNSKHYNEDLSAALRDAFLKTDAGFLAHVHQEKVVGGTTATCVCIRGDKLYAAGAGDSQAMLIRRAGRCQRLLITHNASNDAERSRIEAEGGVMVFWGSWRVGGQLAVTRAIGDADHKPYVTAQPDLFSADLEGDEDFLIVASDGLWETLETEEIASVAYKSLMDSKGVWYGGGRCARDVVYAAQSAGAQDNTTVVVALLRRPDHILADYMSDYVSPPPPECGSADNVADSGDESEDEWNYYAPKTDKQQEQSRSSEDMSSPLNPEAPAFIPEGITTDVAPALSPVCGMEMFKDVVAQSPHKPLPVLEPPDDVTFEHEAANRPNELHVTSEHTNGNGHHHENDSEQSTPASGDMSAAPFDNDAFLRDLQRVQNDTTNLVDVQVEAEAMRLFSKESDPMQRSFYSQEPDLNAVHRLPDGDEDEDVLESHKLAYDQVPESVSEKIPQALNDFRHDDDESPLTEKDDFDTEKEYVQSHFMHQDFSMKETSVDVEESQPAQVDLTAGIETSVDDEPIDANIQEKAEFEPPLTPEVDAIQETHQVETHFDNEEPHQDETHFDDITPQEPQIPQIDNINFMQETNFEETPVENINIDQELMNNVEAKQYHFEIETNNEVGNVDISLSHNNPDNQVLETDLDDDNEEKEFVTEQMDQQNFFSGNLESATSHVSEEKFDAFGAVTKDLNGFQENVANPFSENIEQNIDGAYDEQISPSNVDLINELHFEVPTQIETASELIPKEQDFLQPTYLEQESNGNHIDLLESQDAEKSFIPEQPDIVQDVIPSEAQDKIENILEFNPYHENLEKQELYNNSTYNDNVIHDKQGEEIFVNGTDDYSNNIGKDISRQIEDIDLQESESNINENVTEDISIEDTKFNVQSESKVNETTESSEVSPLTEELPPMVEPEIVKDVQTVTESQMEFSESKLESSVEVPMKETAITEKIEEIAAVEKVNETLLAAAEEVSVPPPTPAEVSPPAAIAATVAATAAAATVVAATAAVVKKSPASNVKKAPTTTPRTPIASKTSLPTKTPPSLTKPKTPLASKPATPKAPLSSKTTTAAPKTNGVAPKTNGVASKTVPSRISAASKTAAPAPKAPARPATAKLAPAKPTAPVKTAAAPRPLSAPKPAAPKVPISRVSTTKSAATTTTTKPTTIAPRLTATKSATTTSSTMKTTSSTTVKTTSTVAAAKASAPRAPLTKAPVKTAVASRVNSGMGKAPPANVEKKPMLANGHARPPIKRPTNTTGAVKDVKQNKELPIKRPTENKEAKLPVKSVINSSASGDNNTESKPVEA